MKNFNLVIVIIIIFIAIVGVVLLSRHQTKVANEESVKITISPTQTSVSPTPTVASPTQIPESYRQKIRSEFISACTSTLGQQKLSQCNCAADYLAANYSPADLLRIYFAYHSTNQIPSEVKAAARACSGK